jgi:hypothetical protein
MKIKNKINLLPEVRAKGKVGNQITELNFIKKNKKTASSSQIDF